MAQFGFPGETIKLISGRLRGRNNKAKAVNHVVVNSGSFGGVIPREFPTTIAPIFTRLPEGQIANSGIAPRIAARPNSAPMLATSDYYSQIPGVGRALGVIAMPFSRQSENVHPAAVSDAIHLRGKVHPTTSRKVLQGDKAL